MPYKSKIPEDSAHEGPTRDIIDRLYKQDVAHIEQVRREALQEARRLRDMRIANFEEKNRTEYLR